MIGRPRISTRLLLVWLTGTAVALAQAPTGLSVDWIFSDEGDAVASVPNHVWLRNGTALLYDTRRPASERALEVLDPSTGSHRRVVDMARAAASLTSLAPDVGAESPLPWPLAFDRDGSRALFVFKDDLFLLALSSGLFSRITSTPDQEKCASFSPDGRHVAFVRANDLFVHDIDTGTETRLTRDGSPSTLNGTLSWVYWEEIFGRHDIGYWWSDDSNAIAYLQTDETPVATSHFVDFQPATPRVILQRYPKAGSPNPQVRVGITDLAASGTTWIQITDKPFEYIARVKWLPDNRRVSVQTLTRDQMELGLYLADRRTGRATRILTETDPGWININDDLSFLKDGRHFLWASERTGFAHLYRYTLDGTLVNPVTRGEWAIASSGGGDVFWLRRAVTGIDEANDWIYFTSLEKSSVERQLNRIKHDGTGLTRLSREEGTHRISMSPDAGYYFDTYSDIQTLPSLRLHRADGERRAVVGPSRPELLAPFDMQYPELITIPATDGFPMPAQILKPKDFSSSRRYPLILYVYGGPSAPTVSNAWQSYHLYNQLLIQEGVIVAQVDNRAATAIGKPLENTILRLSGEPETSDLLAAVRWLKALPYVDPDRVGIWGWSGGGTMTLNAMTRSAEFKAGIAVAPVTDWHYYDTRWAEAFMKRPIDNPDGYERTSLVKRANQLHGRLLLVFGTYDDNVHPQNSQAFINELIAAGRLFDVMIYPMRKHDIGDRAAKRHLFRTMLEFWKRNL